MRPHTFIPAHALRRLLAVGATLVALCPARAADRLQIEIPGRDWVFAMSPRGVDFGPAESSPDGTIWADGDGIDEPGFSITVLIRANDGAAAAADCRAAALGSRLHRNHRARLSDFGGMALAEYSIETYRGEAVAQRRMHGYLFRDGVCIDVGLNVLQYEARHKPMLEAALRSVRLGAAAAEKPNGER